MSRWFRHYAGMMRDDKLVRVAVKVGQPVERVVWVWGAILESAAEINDGGRYDFDAAEAAYFLRATEDDIRAVTAGLESAGRVGSGTVVKWSDRQFESDRSATRQAAYRERKRARDGGHNARKASSDGVVTAASRHGDAPYTETKTDTEAERKRNTRAANADFEVWYAEYPNKVGRQAALKAFEGASRKASLSELVEGVQRYVREKPPDRQWCNPATWLNQERWKDQPAQVQEAVNGKSQGNVIAAADRLVERMRQFDERPGEIRSGEGAPPVRLLSSG